MFDADTDSQEEDEELILQVQSLQQWFHPAFILQVLILRLSGLEPWGLLHTEQVLRPVYTTFSGKCKTLVAFWVSIYTSRAFVFPENENGFQSVKNFSYALSLSPAPPQKNKKTYTHSSSLSLYWGFPLGRLYMVKFLFVLSH